MDVNQVLAFPGVEKASDSPGPSAFRFLVAWFPFFALERCGYLHEEVVALCAFRRNALRIVFLTEMAQEVGLRVGMSASEARAMYPQIRLEMWCEEEEAADWAYLLEAFRGFSDRLQSLRTQILVIEISQTAHLFGGESPLVQLVQERAESMGHRCRVAIADDPMAATIWARSGSAGILPQGATASYLAPLSFMALHPSPGLARSIRGLDIETIGEWAALDPAAVAGRYGEEGLYLHQIARGRVVLRDVAYTAPQTDVVERQEFVEPARQWPLIEFVLRGVLERIGQTLAQRQQRALQLRVHLIGESCEPTVVRVRLGRPSRQTEVLLRLCRLRMERIRLVSPAVACLVEVEQAVPEGAEQVDILDRRQVGLHLPELVARLTDGLGEQAVFQAMETSSWRPEEAWRSRRFGSPERSSPPLKKPDPVEIQQGNYTSFTLPRPSLLLKTPTPLRVKLLEGRPSHVKWEGRWWAVRRVEGPEKIAIQWWREDGGLYRKYWVVDFEGRICWIFEDEYANWALHGWFG